MRRTISILVISVVTILSGCSFLEETKNTLNYATEATEYFNELSTFAEETSNLANEGGVNVEELETKLTELEQQITDFNSIEVPGLAEDIHQDIISNNEKLLETINNIQENGEVAIEELKNSDIVQTIESITGFMNQIEQLGFE